MFTTHFTVSINGQPNIKGILESSSMSTITKSIKKVNWWTLTKTSSITPYGLVMERSASWRVILVGAILRFPILRHIETNIKLMLAPISIRVLPTDTSLIEHGMVTLLGSLNFYGRILWITTLQFPSTMMLSLLMYFLFFVRRSFINLVYKGIYCKTSLKGMVISNFLKMSRKWAK